MTVQLPRSRVDVVVCPGCKQAMTYVYKKEAAARRRKLCPYCQKKFEVARATKKSFEHVLEQEAFRQAQRYANEYNKQNRNDHGHWRMTNKLYQSKLDRFRQAFLIENQQLESGRTLIRTRNGQWSSPHDQMTNARLEPVDVSVDWTRWRGVFPADLYTKLLSMLGGKWGEPFVYDFGVGSVVVHSSGVTELHFDSDSPFSVGLANGVVEQLYALAGVDSVTWSNGQKEVTFRSGHGGELSKKIHEIFGPETRMLWLEQDLKTKWYCDPKNGEDRVEARSADELVKHVKEVLQSRLGGNMPVSERVIILEHEDRYLRERIHEIGSEIANISKRLETVNTGISQGTELLMTSLNEVASGVQSQKDQMDFVESQVHNLSQQNRQITEVLNRLVERTDMQIRLTRDQILLLERLDLNVLEVIDELRGRVVPAMLTIVDYIDTIYGEFKSWHDLSVETRQKVLELAEKHDVSMRSLSRLLRCSHASIHKFKRKLESIENHVARATDHLGDNGHSLAFSFGHHSRDAWSERQKIIYDFVLENPGTTAAEIAANLNIPRKAVWTTLNRTTMREFVEKRGRSYYPKKGGNKKNEWENSK